MTMAELKEHARLCRELEQAAYRICEALTGTCVMTRRRKDQEPCDMVNCTAYRAAMSENADHG